MLVAPKICSFHWSQCGARYRKNTATFHAVLPASAHSLPPAPAGTHAWGRPARLTLPAWRRPCQGGPALAGASGRAASATGAARARPLPPLAPPTLSPPRHRPRSSPAHQRPGAAAWHSQRWPLDGGGWPCAAWVLGRGRRWGCWGGAKKFLDSIWMGSPRSRTQATYGELRRRLYTNGG